MPSMSNVRLTVTWASRMITAVLRQSFRDAASRARDASIREAWSTGLAAFTFRSVSALPAMPP
jgi:hypothetical protein